MSTFVNAVFGSKPKSAKFKPLKPGDEQSKSLLGNIANFDDITKLGDLYRNFITSQEEALLPGYKDTLALGEKATQNILRQGDQLVSGNLPDDVKDQIYRSDAFTALSGGYGGSGMAHSLTARDLGLTSLDLMRQGAEMIGRGGNSAQQWSSMARGDIMNPSSQFLSPEFTANYDLQNRVLHQQSQQNQYNVSAAPNPVAKGVSDTIIELLGAYLGAGKGGGGGIAANSYTPAGSVSYNSGGDIFGTNQYGGSNLLGGW